MEAYRDWLKRKHPTCWKQYWNYFRRFPQPESFAAWLEGLAESEKIHARKAARKLRDFLVLDGQSRAAEIWGAACGCPARAEEVSGTLRQRQISTMRALWAASDLPAKRIGLFRLDQAEELAAKYPKCKAALDRWRNLRERCAADPAFLRKQRAKPAWASSEYLFPSPSGGPSRLRTPARPRKPSPESPDPKTGASSPLRETASGRWFRSEAFAFDGELLFFGDLSEQQKAELSRNPEAVYLEGWFRLMGGEWDGPYLEPEAE